MSFNALFSNNNESGVTTGANQLQKTAQLTTLAMSIANDIMKAIENDEEKYAPMVVASQSSHDEMDKLINEVINLSTTDWGFLIGVSIDDLDKMIRSQQSKRSRSKTKVMTMETYKTMMTGAISENLLRIAAAKPKSSTGGGAHASNLVYSEEQITEFINDQDKLKKEIRNVQSKKSIAKSKAGFSESDERWLLLLDAEETLKNLRVGGNTTTTVTVVDERVDKLLEMLDSANDLSKLSNKDAKGLLAKVKEMFGAVETVETEINESAEQ